MRSEDYSNLWRLLPPRNVATAPLWSSCVCVLTQLSSWCRFRNSGSAPGKAHTVSLCFHSKIINLYTSGCRYICFSLYLSDYICICVSVCLSVYNCVYVYYILSVGSRDWQLRTQILELHSEFEYKHFLGKIIQFFCALVFSSIKKMILAEPTLVSSYESQTK